MREGMMLLTSSLLLFGGCLPGARPPEGRALRVVGRVTGFDSDPERVEVHCGSGPRRTVSDHQRAEHGWSSNPSTDENRAWNLDLPTIASHWEVRKPGLDGSFDCGSMDAEGPPQLIVVDRSGRLATREIPLPIGAHSILQAGEISPQETLTLEIDGSGLPETDLPLALMAGIDRAEVSPGTEAAVALHLALLTRVFPRLAHFAMGRGGTPVESKGSPARISGLPGFSRLDLYVTGPLPGILATYSVTPAADGLVKISLSETELLGSRPRVPLSGVVRWPDGSPVPGATVVYGSYPDRVEIRTDGEGRFEIPRAAAGREAVLFVDAPLPGCRPPFDRVTKTHRLDIDEGAKAVETKIDLPSALEAGCTGPGGEREKDLCNR
ncbi:MAG TPA: carboxypeptidase-like regulatory domain-containing protein [Thermoanaerobaculia bacterium]